MGLDTHSIPIGESGIAAMIGLRFFFTVEYATAEWAVLDGPGVHKSDRLYRLKAWNAAPNRLT
jgi:hypothetical protein